MAWTPPPIQNTPDYRSAKYRYDQFQKFNGMSTPQLVDNLKQGEITTEMNNLLAQNPNYQLAKQQMQAYQNTQNINNAVNGFSSGINGKEIDTPDYLQALSDKILTKLGLSETSAQQAFKDIVTNDSKVVDYTNQLSAINRQVADTTKLLNDGYKDLKAQYGDMPSSALITLMNSRFSTANDTLANLNNSKSYLEADLKNAVEMARGEYEAAAQDIQQNNALRNNVLGQAIWAEFNIATKQIEDEIDRKAKAAALKDPATAIQTVMDEYKKLGIPFTSTIQSRLAEFEASGLPLADYLTQMTQNIQASPAYQKYKSLQEGQLSDAQKLSASQSFDLKKMGLEQDFQMKLAQAKSVTDSKWTKLDDWLYTNDKGEIITADELKTSKLVNNSYITKEIWSEWGECGFYASRGTGMTSTPGGNSKEERVKAFSDKAPQVWWMVFFGWPWYDATYWHISIVTGVNADGTINVKDSNYNGDMKVWERTVPASSATWYYNNTPLANGISTVSKDSSSYDDQNIADLAYLVELQDKNPTQAAKDMKELGYTARDIANYKAGNVPLTEKQKTISSELMNDIADLVQNYDFTDATGIHWFEEAARGSDWENANTKIESIVSKLTLPSLWMLKWPMSDKDLAFIKAASNNLATSQSDASFEKQLIKAYNLAARRAGKPEIKKLSELSVENDLANSF